MKILVSLIIVTHIYSLVQGTTTVEEPGVVKHHPVETVLPIELTCDVSPGVAWVVNNVTYLLNRLQNGNLPGHNVNGSNILITSNPMNNSQYVCSDGINDGGVYRILVAGIPAMVPNVAEEGNTISINGSIVTLTLSWGEPFNNCDSIVNYTVSCSGDDTCPENFTTIDNTTRTTITNLTTMTNYTFSVVATNSIGSGEAGMRNYITPVIDQVTGVMLTCEPVDVINECHAMWNSVKEATEYQVVYVCRNGIIKSFTSSTTEVTFPAPSLSGDVFTDAVVVMVTAMNDLGIGPASDPVTAAINASSVISVVFSIPDIITESYNINITCTDGYCSLMATVNSSVTRTVDESTPFTYNISGNCTTHPESSPNICELIAIDNNNVTITGSASITNGNASVTVYGLECGVDYTVVAGGTFNGSLIGPRRLVAIINTTDSCDELTAKANFTNNTNSGGHDNSTDDGPVRNIVVIILLVTGIVVIFLIGGIVGSVIIVSKCRKNKNCKKNKRNSIDPEKDGNKQNKDEQTKTVNDQKDPEKDGNKQNKDEQTRTVNDQKDLEKDGNKQKKDKKKKSAKKSEGKDTLTQLLQDKVDSPEPKDMAMAKHPLQGVYTEVKDKRDSTKAKQAGQLTYVDLDIQKGPNRFGDDCHAVDYGQVAETKQ